MARAMHPFPPSKGWTVTNHRWARAALRTSLVSGGPFSYSRKAAISPGTKDGLLPEADFQGLHAAQEIALEVADPAELGGEGAVIPGECGPVRPLVQVLVLNVCGGCVDREFPDAESASR